MIIRDSGLHFGPTCTMQL